MSEIKITGIPGGSDGQRRVVRVNVIQAKPSQNLPSPATEPEPVLEETGLMPAFEDDEAAEADRREITPEQAAEERYQKALKRQSDARDKWLKGDPKPGPLSSYYDEGDPEYKEFTATVKKAQPSRQVVQVGSNSFLEEKFGGSGNGGGGSEPTGRGPEGRHNRRGVKITALGVIAVLALGAGYEAVHKIDDLVTSPGPNHKVIESDSNVVKPSATAAPTEAEHHHKNKAHAKATKQPEVSAPSPTPAEPETTLTTQPTPTPPPKPTKAELAVAAMPLGLKIDQLVDVRMPSELAAQPTPTSSGSKDNSETSPAPSTESLLVPYQDNGNLIFSGLPSEELQKQIASLKKNSVYAPEITFSFDQDGQLPPAFAPGAKPAETAKELQTIKEAGADRIVLPVNLDLSRAVGGITSLTKPDLLSANDLTKHIRMLAAVVQKHGLQLSLNSFPTEYYAGAGQSLDAVPLAQMNDAMATELDKRSRLVINLLKDSEVGVYINANAEVPKGIKLYSDNRSPALNSFAANVLHREGYQQTPAVGLVEYAAAHPKNAEGKKETLSDYAIQALHVGATSIVLEQSPQAQPLSTNPDVQPVAISQQADQLRAGIKAAVKSGEISVPDLNEAVLANLQGRDGGVLRVIRHIKKQAAAEAKAATAKTSEQPSSSATATATPSATATSPTKTKSSQTKTSSTTTSKK